MYVGPFLVKPCCTRYEKAPLFTSVYINILDIGGAWWAPAICIYIQQDVMLCNNIHIYLYIRHAQSYSYYIGHFDVYKNEKRQCVLHTIVYALHLLTYTIHTHIYTYCC